MNNRVSTIMMVAGLLLVVLYQSLYTIKQSERGVKLRFGRIIAPDLQPGLGVKVPFIDEIKKFDSRVLSIDLRPEDYFTQEKKPLKVDSYVMWRIDDVEKFYTAARGDTLKAESLIAPRVNDGLRNKFAERTVYEVVSGEREQLLIDLTQEVSVLTQTSLGIEVIDIRVKRIDLPPQVSNSVFDRMRAERDREAQEHRSKGKELAEGIRADADRQEREILADAYRQAEIIRGEGDAQSIAIYAHAFNQDQEFYDFYRSLSAYRNTFSDKSDVWVLSPDSEFFDYLKSATR